MLDTLHTVLAFIVAIALLIAVHEYGHFIVARKLGIRVEKFSIGFGPRLFSWFSRDGEVEYIIAAIPLGGYVKMLGEHSLVREDEPVDPIQAARAFDRQPVWKRAAVAAAGPLFNFVFAIFAYMAIGWIGQSVMPSVVGSVAPSSLAERAGFLLGDQIRSVGGSSIYSWMQLETVLKEQVGRDVEIVVRRGENELPLKFHLDPTEKDPLLINVAEEVVGIGPGLRVLVDSVLERSPAAQAGLLPMDRIVQVAGVPVHGVGDFIALIRDHGGERITLTLERQGSSVNVDIVPSGSKGSGRIGARMTAQSLSEPVIYRMGPIDGVLFGFERTWEMTVLTLKVIGKMATAAISPENLGGPIAIAQLAGKTAELGVVAFITFLALISVNLGVLNLLPVPILDGGHLLFLAVEKAMRRPLSPVVLERLQMVGISLIVMLMLLAFYNDLIRLFKG